MLELVDYPCPPDLRSLSPFVYKAEVLLALAGIDYVKIDAAPDLMPHGKVPVLRDAGRLIPDSSLIQRHLERHYGLSVDAGLTGQERALAEAFRRMTEEHLRWVVLYERWVDPVGEPALRAAAFAGLPEEAAIAAFAEVRGEVVGHLHAQGLGRHAPDDLYRFGLDDLDAIAAWLDDKPFLMGDRLTSVDASVAGLLYALGTVATPTPLCQHLRAVPTLAAYAVRVEETVFGAKARVPAGLAALAALPA